MSQAQCQALRFSVKISSSFLWKRPQPGPFVLNNGGTSEPPGELNRINVLLPHPQPTKSESLVVESSH